MKSITKILLLTIISVIVMSCFVESNKTRHSRARDDKDKKVKKPNYKKAKAKVALDYAQIDETYKSDALKEIDLEKREEKLSTHTIRKVFKLFGSKEAEITKCLDSLVLSEQRDLILKIFADRASATTQDLVYITNKSKITEVCRAPLALMKKDLLLYMNKYLDLVREFKYQARKLRKLRNKLYKKRSNE